METMLQGDMKMKNVELNTLMNLDKSIVFSIDTNFQSRTYEMQLPDTTLISSSRSDIKQFDASIGLVKLQQEYEKSKRLPDFGISLSHMQSLGSMPNSYAAMGMVSIPIVPWASKEYKSNIKGLDNTLNAINYQKQSLVNETAGMVASLQSQIKTAKQQLANYKENIIPTYYKSYQTSMIGYEQNTEDLFVVLDGLKMYRMAKMNELEQLNTLLKLQVDYEKELEIR
jgi:outer membrane protein TolC